MDLILISSKKLKVSLDSEETKKYNIPTKEKLNYTCDKKSLNLLLFDIKSMCGFDTGDDDLTFEIFESKDGGCDMYITRSYNTYEGNGIKKLSYILKHELIYVFYDIEHLIFACKKLSDLSLSNDSKVYESKDIYYLTIKKSQGFSKCDLDSLIFMKDISDEVNTCDTNIYLSEHANEILSQNAIDVLAML